MSVSQFGILEQELVDALSQVKPAELNRRRGYVDMVLEEYDDLENRQKANLNLVSFLNRQLSDHTYLDLSLFNLVIAEKITNRIKANNEESNFDLVNCGIAAINHWKIYRDKYELAKKRKAREIALRNTKAAKKMNVAKHKPLNVLVTRIFEIYEPTTKSLRNEGKPITYFNIARRIGPQVQELNRQPSGRYLLGGENDPIGAIKRRLEKAVRDGALKSTRDYKKH